MFNWFKTLFNPPIWQLYRQLEAQRDSLALFYPRTWRFRLTTVGGDTTRWTSCLLVVTVNGMRGYLPASPAPHLAFQWTPDALRWFGRPQKYHDGENELLIHLQITGSAGAAWQRLELRSSRYEMTTLIRAMKQIATPEQITAYRRRRPYVHYGPLPAVRAEQDIYGAWELGAPVTVYLTPAFLVILNGTQVERALPLAQVQSIEARRRLDAPTADGLVRFRVGEETLTYATSEYEALAQALAEAARRTLEAPIARKQKKKEDDAHYEWDEDPD